MKAQILPGIQPKLFAHADCLTCKKKFTMKNPVDWNDYVLWMQGMLIQDATPYLSADDRDILMGSVKGAYVCPDCWGEDE